MQVYPYEYWSRYGPGSSAANSAAARPRFQIRESMPGIIREMREIEPNGGVRPGGQGQGIRAITPEEGVGGGRGGGDGNLIFPSFFLDPLLSSNLMFLCTFLQGQRDENPSDHILLCTFLQGQRDENPSDHILPCTFLQGQRDENPSDHILLQTYIKHALKCCDNFQAWVDFEASQRIGL